MLKGIPSLLSPELLMVLSEMGHRDEILVADRNFPSKSMTEHLIRLDGHGIPGILDAILRFFPLDESMFPVTLETVLKGDDPIIWDEYRQIAQKHDMRPKGELIQKVNHAEFYEKVANCYAVIATGEKSLYGNIILKKGLVLD